MLLLTHTPADGFGCQFGCFWCQKPVDIQTAVVVGPFNDVGIDATLAATSMPLTVVGQECLNSPGVKQLQQIYKDAYASRPLLNFFPALIAELQSALPVSGK
jgi:hypothetical protein